MADLVKKCSSAGNLVNTTVKWLNVSMHTFGEQEKTVFLDIAKRLPSKEKKKLKGRLPELTQLISRELSDAIYKELEMT